MAERLSITSNTPVVVRFPVRYLIHAQCVSYTKVNHRKRSRTERDRNPDRKADDEDQTRHEPTCESTEHARAYGHKQPAGVFT